MRNRIFPPTYLNALLLLEIVLHFLLPVRQIFQVSFTYIGIVVLAVGLVLNGYTVTIMNRQGTTSEFYESADRLIVTGPFRISRNPIYLSGMLVAIGLAILLGSLIAFVVPVAIFLILNGLHIPDEERRLEEQFGQEYLDYRRRVRRWI